MQWNVLELSQNGRYVKLYRGFLLVMEGESELGRIIIEELSCLVLTAQQATLSKQVMVRLAEEGIPIIVCGKNYHPISLCLPYSAHHQSTKILGEQIASTKPLRKRLWQIIVSQKIRHQALALKQWAPKKEIELRQLNRLTTTVKSGDPANVEAQASKIYWRALMGDHFRRNVDLGDFVNIALNYGYSIIRAACARAVVAAGLTPALGIYHKNQNNPFCLVDDLMEVYRPLVDFTVVQMESADNLLPEHKRILVGLLQADIKSGDSSTTLTGSMQKLAFSLVKSYQAKEATLQLPEMSFS